MSKIRMDAFEIITTTPAQGSRALWRRARYLGAVILIGVAAGCSSPEERLEEYSQSGQTYLADGDIGRANVQFQNALKINEEHIPTLLGLVQIAEQKGDYKSLFGLLHKIVRLDPQHIEAQVKIGKLYLVARDEAAALEHAEKALAIKADDIGAITLMSAIQFKLGDNVRAVELARSVLAVDPANPEAVTVIATERTLAGEYEEALSELDQAIAIKPDIAILQLLRIGLLGRLEREDDVRAAYADLIQLFPEEVAYRRVYTADLIAREQYAEASTQLDIIVGLEPENMDAKLDVVRVIMKEEGIEAATVRMRGYVEADSANSDLKFLLADYLLSIDDRAGASEVFSGLAQSDDASVELRAKNLIAAEHLRNNENDQAEAIIEEILKSDQRNTGALIKRAGLLVGNGQYDAAILDLRSALDNDPDSSEARVLMAMAFERQESPGTARAEFTKAFEVSGQNSKIGNAFAKFHLRQDNSVRAEEVLVASLAAHPGHIENLKLLAGVRLSQQNWRGAEEVSEILARLENQDEVAERIRTAAYAGLGDYDKMIKTLTEQNENEPLASRPLSTLVAAYLRSDRVEEAQELLLRIISTREDNYAAYILLAQVYGSKQQSDDAEKTLLAAVKSDGTRAEAFELLYRFYQRKRQPEKAVTLIENGLAIAPDSTALRVFKADALLSEGKVAEAFEIYQILVVERPNNRIVANNFVSLSSDLRQDAASVEFALGAAKVLEGEENPLFQDTLGWANYRAGNFDMAVEYLSLAAQNASQSAEIHYHLGAAFFAAGDEGNAKATLEKALETGGDGFKYADEINMLLARL